MKPIFAGLILFFAIGAAAQTSNANRNQKKLTPEKMREVILADERQHEAKAPITVTSNSYNNVYKLQPSTQTPVTKSNYVAHHHDALLSGLGTALLFAKQFTRYANYSGEAQAYYRVPY